MSTDSRDGGFVPPDDPLLPDPSRDPSEPGMPDPNQPAVPGDDPLITDPDEDGRNHDPDGEPVDPRPLTDPLNPPRA